MAGSIVAARREFGCNGRDCRGVWPRVNHEHAASFSDRWLRVRPGEWKSLLASAAYFALVLFGYFLLRPIREAMGVARSMDDLRWLFVVTCVASLAAAVAFGGIVSRLDRARFIWVGHLVVAACLLILIVARPSVDDASKVTLGYVFYVWLSVVNLFLTSIFWAFMADVWTLEQGKRLFAMIAVGGTLGALGGSALAWRVAEVIGVSWQLALAAACFLLTMPFVRAIDRRERSVHAAPARRVGGHWIDGVRLLVRSPYLLGTALYVVLIAVSATLLYFTRADLVANAQSELEARISIFAQMDAWTQAATLVVQLFVTGRLIRRVGVGVTLMVLPAVTLAGFAVLAWMESREGIEGWQILGAVTAISAIHSATRYAVARPTRETLFNVVREDEKYKAKPIIDVFIFRGGDVAGAWMTGMVAGLWGMFMLALPLAAAWGGLCVLLAAAQQRRADARDRSNGSHAAAAAEGATT